MNNFPKRKLKAFGGLDFSFSYRVKSSYSNEFVVMSIKRLFFCSLFSLVRPEAKAMNNNVYSFFSFTFSI
jgi:hypothetical protein